MFIYVSYYNFLQFIPCESETGWYWRFELQSTNNVTVYSKMIMLYILLIVMFLVQILLNYREINITVPSSGFRSIRPFHQTVLIRPGYAPLSLPFAYVSVMDRNELQTPFCFHITTKSGYFTYKMKPLSPTGTTLFHVIIRLPFTTRSGRQKGSCKVTARRTEGVHTLA